LCAEEFFLCDRGLETLRMAELQLHAALSLMQRCENQNVDAECLASLARGLGEGAPMRERSEIFSICKNSEVVKL
jgi:type II secretory pathway component PulF